MADLSAVDAHVKIEWVGFRKDGGKGSFWGYFTPVGQPEAPITYYDRKLHKFVCTDRYYYKFSGKVGKSVIFEKGYLDGKDTTIYDELAHKKLNFREITSEKFFKIIGSQPINDFEMFISFTKMIGDYTPPVLPENDYGI